MKITLTPEEYGSCHLIMANKLYLNKEADIKQIVASYSFAKWQNIFFNPIDDDSQHTIMFSGRKILFYISNDDHMSFDISKAKKIDGDIVVLTRVNEDSVDFVGYAKVSDIYVWENVVITGDLTKEVTITINDLHKFKEDVESGE
jgi:hypothetical protein